MGYWQCLEVLLMRDERVNSFPSASS
ncbi:hypothetical protein M3J09_012014 [Ascochyta lentis]